LADIVLKNVVTAEFFFTIRPTFAVFFLHDLASAYQILSKRDHSRQSFNVISIFQFFKIVATELEI